MAVICRNLGAPRKLIAAPIQYLASFTFSLYLFHWPLLKMYAILFDHDATSLTDQYLLFSVVLATIWVLGNISERQKHLFRRLVEAVWNLIARGLPQRRAG